MTDRSTTAATAADVRPRRTGLRLRQTVAVSMLAGGLVLGAFAAPSLADDTEVVAAPDARTSALQVAAAAGDPLVCQGDETPLLDGCVLPGNSGGGNGGENGGENGGGNGGGNGGDGPDVDPCDLLPNGCETTVPSETPTVTLPTVTPPTGGPPETSGPTQTAGPVTPTIKPPSTGKPTTKPSTRPSTGGGGNGTTGNGTTGNGTSGNGSLGTQVGNAEGTVPGAEAPAAVTACGDSVICQAAPTQTTTSSSTTGLPETGAAANSQGLLFLGFGLVGAGAFLLRPRPGGRHRLADGIS